jgi:hypothetical protein
VSVVYPIIQAVPWRIAVVVLFCEKDRAISPPCMHGGPPGAGISLSFHRARPEDLWLGDAPRTLLMLILRLLFAIF